MNKEELYKLAISDVSTYPLLNEILAIRDNRFPNEKVDYCINVNGYISLDTLNKYVNAIQENQQLKEVIEEAREYIKDSCYYPELENYSNMTDNEVKELVQILNKVKGE